MSYSFHRLIENAIHQSDLRRVRIKVDPQLSDDKCSFSDINGYEGYVLQEQDGVARVFVLGTDEEPNIHNIPSNNITSVQPSCETYEMFKEVFLSFLDHEGHLEGNIKIIDIVLESTQPTELRQICDQLGVSDSDLLKCYEYFIKS
jgi:hypothetical protein